MYKIAREHKLTVNELANLNPQIKNINLIYTGETIITNKNERDLLTRIVHAEAEGESHEGKVAVALVVLNRVDSKDFPNTITDVIYQKGQFSPVSNGRINTITPTNASVVAVNEALEKRYIDRQSLFFYNPAIATSRWLDTRETVRVVDNHVFKK